MFRGSFCFLVFPAYDLFLLGRVGLGLFILRWHSGCSIQATWDGVWNVSLYLYF